MSKGFTFLEIIITILVITVGLTGVYSFIQAPISYTNLSISRLTAIHLAQEGIEIVRNLRDENWVRGREWDFHLAEGPGFNGCHDTPSKYCEADYLSEELDSIPEAQDPAFLKINNDGFYEYENGIDTKFTRKIKINDDTSDYLEVSVVVEWTNKGEDYSVEVQENLYNWWKF